MEKESRQTVVKFYIGKTYVRQRKKPGAGHVRINPHDSSTYRKHGISSRWGKHKHKDYGRDGMVVLTIVTKKTIPPEKKHIQQEDYALDLESALIHECNTTPAYKRRIANKCLSKGKRDNKASAGYALYMAFTLEGPLPEKTDEDSEEPTSSEEDEDKVQQVMDFAIE